MEKNKRYPLTVFNARVIEEAHDLFLGKLDPEEAATRPQILSVRYRDEQWSFDSREEFLAELPNGDAYEFDDYQVAQDCRLRLDASGFETRVLVSFTTRPPIEAVFQVFERNVAICRTQVTPTIFIGHGQSGQWRELRDHLQDQHGFKIVAYEVGPRAGLSVKDVLEDMLESASFALLVLTAEDLHQDGALHARENVIHELGLFQGRLGFTQAIAVLEEGVREFSNILGINQVRFPTGRIRETFGDVVATLHREFPR